MNNENSRVVVHIARSPQTGVWSFIKNLTVWQAKNSKGVVAVRIIADRKWPQEYYSELKSLPLDRGYRKVPFWGCGTVNYCLHILKNPVSKWINALIQEYHPDTVIIHFHNAWLSGSYLPVSIKNPLVKSFVTFHGIADSEKLRKKKLRRKIHSWLANRLLTNKAKLISVDKEGAKTANELFGIPVRHFTIIPNGVDRNWAISTETHTKNSTSEKNFTIGFVSSFYPEKGWNLVAEAALIVSKKIQGIHLVLAGDGPDKKRVQEWVNANKEISEFRGFVHDPVNQIMDDLNVLVLPSSNEGLPMVILEALSCSVPVLATPVGGIPEVIKDGINGFLIERDPRSIAIKLEYLWQNPSEYIKMKNEAKKSFFKNFTMDICGKRYEELYQS